MINRSQMSKVVYKASCWDCQDSYIGKRNVDCMTEKLNFVKVSQVPVMHLLKWDHFEILAKGRSDTHCKIKGTANSGTQTYPKRYCQQRKALSVLVCIFLMQIFLSFCHCYF